MKVAETHVTTLGKDKAFSALSPPETIVSIFYMYGYKWILPIYIELNKVGSHLYFATSDNKLPINVHGTKERHAHPPPKSHSWLTLPTLLKQILYMCVAFHILSHTMKHVQGQAAK